MGQAGASAEEVPPSCRDLGWLWQGRWPRPHARDPCLSQMQMLCFCPRLMEKRACN